MLEEKERTQKQKWWWHEWGRVRSLASLNVYVRRRWGWILGALEARVSGLNLMEKGKWGQACSEMHACLQEIYKEQFPEQRPWKGGEWAWLRQPWHWGINNNLSWWPGELGSWSIFRWSYGAPTFFLPRWPVMRCGFLCPQRCDLGWRSSLHLRAVCRGGDSWGMSIFWGGGQILHPWRRIWVAHHDIRHGASLPCLKDICCQWQNGYLEVVRCLWQDDQESPSGWKRKRPRRL